MKKINPISKYTFIFLMLVLFLGGIFKNTSQIMRVSSLSLIIGTLITSVIIFIMYYLYNKIIKKINITTRLEIKIVTLLSIIIIALLSISGYLLRNFGDSNLEEHNFYEWDLRIAIGYTNTLLDTNDFSSKKTQEYIDYTKLYSNVDGVVMLLIPIYKLFKLCGIKSLVAPGIILNILFIYISFLLSYIIARKLFDKEKAIFYLIISLIFTPLYINASIFWSDTLSMPFLLAIFAIYLYNEEKLTKINRKSLSIFIIIGILTAIGASVKMTVILLTLSIFIDLITKKISKAIVYFCGFLLSFVTIFFIIKIVIIPTIFPYDRGDLKLHYTHYIMLGLTESLKDKEEGDKVKIYGAYNYGDVLYSLFGGYNLNLEKQIWIPNGRFYSVLVTSKSTSKERQYREIKKIKKIIKERSVTDHINFFYSKYIETWADGSCYLPIKVSRGYLSENWLGNIVRVNGKYFKYYYNVSHYIHMSFILFILIGCIYGIKNRENDQLSIIKINIIMLVFLLLIWETRSRYIINNLLLLYILIIPGLDYIYTMFTKHKKVKRVK